MEKGAYCHLQVTETHNTATLLVNSEDKTMNEETFQLPERMKHLDINVQRVAQGPPSILELQATREEKLFDDAYKREYAASKLNISVTEKVILVVGATGSGKTTLINGMINYILGVKFSDEYRLKLIIEATEGNQANSQTSMITSYTIHHQKDMLVPYTLTIIDTPGFGDTRGITRDQIITNQVRDFFTSKSGIVHLDAVCFVAQSSLPRLTATQKYIFDSIQALFGKDIKDNIFMMLTFADGHKPQILDGLNMAGLPTDDGRWFKFNNSALFVVDSSTAEDSDEENFDKMFWKLGTASFKKFFIKLGSVSAKSLQLTQDVLKQRKHLEVYIAGIQLDIKRGLSTLENLKTEKEVLLKHKSDIERNQNFTYDVVEDTVKTEKTQPGIYTTNCIPCQMTCHYPCEIKDDSEKIWCAAMRDNYCTVCRKKCIWSDHINAPHIFTVKQEKKTKTSQELLEKYKDAQEKHTSTEHMVYSVMKEFEIIQLQVMYQANEIRNSLQRLREIALKPNPLSAPEYIDLLIEAEKSAKQPGWKNRLTQLDDIRKQAQLMQEYEDQGYDPFKDYRKALKLYEDQGQDPFEEVRKRIAETDSKEPVGKPLWERFTNVCNKVRTNLGR